MPCYHVLQWCYLVRMNSKYFNTICISPLHRGYSQTVLDCIPLKKKRENDRKDRVWRQTTSFWEGTLSWEQILSFLKLTTKNFRRDFVSWESKQEVIIILYTNQLYIWCPCNFYHLWANSADDKLIFFLFFPRKLILTFHANCLLRKQFAWNVKPYFLKKNKTKQQNK